MKIDKAIMSVNDNPLYTDFWEPVSKVWNKRLGIRPVLIYFGEKDLSTEWGDVVKVPYVSGVPEHFQTQWARFWYTTQEPETIFVVSDIDMFPMSRRFFVDRLEGFSSEKYIHLNGKHRPLPVCYHAAKGKMFKTVLGLADTFEESCKEVWESDLNMLEHMGFQKWGIDEAYTTKKLLEYNSANLFLTNNGVGPRLDRSMWPIAYDVENYVDCHSLRPYSTYKEEIDKLVTKLT